MRILVVSEPYAPTLHAEALCTAKLAQALAAEGHEVHVVTRHGGHVRDTPTDTSARWRRDDGVRVTRLRPRGPRPWRRVRDLVAGWRSGMPGTKAWHLDATLVALSAHRERRFDVVLTRHVGERAAFVGCALSRAGLPWVAAFADPAPPCLHLPPYGPGAPRTRRERRQVATLASWLSEASAVVYPCERLARHHARALGLPPSIPRLIVPHIGGHGAEADEDPPPAAAPGGPREVRLVHAGLWMKGRLLDDLVSALADAAAHARSRGAVLRLEFLGPLREDLVSRVRSLGAAESVRFSGQVPYEQSLAHMRAASGLLVAEAALAEGIYFPSKLADYATARRPVLAFGPREGTVADILGPGHPGLLGLERAGARDGAVRFVDRLLQGGEAAVAPWHVPAPERFEPATVARRFARDLQGLLARSPS